MSIKMHCVRFGSAIACGIGAICATRDGVAWFLTSMVFTIIGLSLMDWYAALAVKAPR